MMSKGAVIPSITTSSASKITAEVARVSVKVLAAGGKIEEEGKGGGGGNV